MHPGGRTVWLNALALRPGGSGVQTYIRELVRALAERPDVSLVAAVQRDCAAELPEGVAAVPRPVSDGLRRLWESSRPPHGAHLVHGLDVDLPWRSGVPTVTTVHDTAVVDVPWAFSRGRALAERALLRRALRVADEVVCVSDFTAQRVEAISGRRGQVVPLAPASWTRIPSTAEVSALRERLALPPTFVLQVASVEPRKNVDLLVAAGRAAGVPVVLAGAGSLERSGAGVLGLGYVDRNDLPALYAAATVVAYLSRYEGFGLPPLEAMACGAAVMTSRTPPMPSVLGTGAAFVGEDGDEVAAVLRRLVSDDAEREELAAEGRAVAAGYTWTRTAALTADVYDRAWGSTPGSP